MILTLESQQQMKKKIIFLHFTFLSLFNQTKRGRNLSKEYSKVVLKKSYNSFPFSVVCFLKIKQDQKLSRTSKQQDKLMKKKIIFLHFTFLSLFNQTNRCRNFSKEYCKVVLKKSFNSFSVVYF